MGCKYNLGLDVDARGNIKLNPAAKESCALDFADRGGSADLVTVGELVNLTRERVRQIEAMGLRMLRPMMEEKGIYGP
jgi:DNA-directed RNA polymerase sigma subunit (sigma70/sigma32)